MSDAPSAQTSSLRATAHPIRLRMLSLLTNNELSASDLARELEITTANASYHLRLLAKAGLAVETGTDRIRGGVAKRFTHPWEDTASAKDSTPAELDGYVRTLATELVRRFAERAERSRLATTDAELWVDPEVRDRVLELIEEAAHLLHGQAQPARTPGTERVSLTTAIFTMESTR